MTHAQRSGVAATALLALAAAASAVAAPPVAQPVPARHSADASFARLEHEYVTYVLERFPVVATYLGGAQFNAQLALGAHFSAQRFHLKFMKQGTIPPGYFGEELLRALRGAP